MSTQETVRYEAHIVLSTESGECPSAREASELISSQMEGVLDDSTGLTCLSVSVLRVTGELE